jgi:hypothetical protein
MEALYLARIVNKAMIKYKPEGWLKYPHQYVKSDMIVTDLLWNPATSLGLTGNCRATDYARPLK